MAKDSQFAVQTAVYDALRADSSLKSLISDPVRVYDHTPQNSVAPYIVIGETRGLPFDTKDTDGMDQSLMIHVWSEYRGLKETKQIQAAIMDAIDQVSLSITGHSQALLRFEFSDVFLDADGLTRHGVQRFRIVTEGA